MNWNGGLEAVALASGSYDLHTHTNPSHFPRSLDDVALLKEANALGMAGVMIKSHYEPTGAHANLLNLHCTGSTKAYGGVVLNHPVGGLNPYAVESALHMGASIVWMPTRDAANCLQYGNMSGDFFSRPGITILNEKGKLKDQVYEIFDIVKNYHACLASGHISTEESILLCKEGCRRNIQMVLTHPEWERTKVSIEVQQALADCGTIIEKNWLNIAEGHCTAAYMAHTIRILGSERVYLATDRGQLGFEHPAEGMLRFIDAMLACGIAPEEIRTMIIAVPKRLLGIHPDV